MKLRHKIRFAAIGITLAYSVLRFLLVGASLTSYGINPWIFLALDIITAATYVIGVEKLIAALIKKGKYPLSKTIVWGVVAAISFAIPYLYLLTGGQSLPMSFLLGLGFIVLLLLIGAIFSIVRQVRRSSAK
ncbi:MAG TPA: hypothetical protein VM581_02815 [Magnetospirillaceae bacterium]|nr:hypothetical protein [Magnetospirillaceae bacterium]